MCPVFRDIQKLEGAGPSLQLALLSPAPRVMQKLAEDGEDLQSSPFNEGFLIPLLTYYSLTLTLWEYAIKYVRDMLTILQ